MITGIEIHGYRCFKQFELDRLARVNLLVGKNNSGKTALLEAVELATSSAEQLGRFLSPLYRRGEVVTEERERLPDRQIVEIRHLFAGHRIEVGSELKIQTGTHRGNEWVRYSVVRAEPEEGPLLPHGDNAEHRFESPLAMRVETHVPDVQASIPLSIDGGLNVDPRYGRRLPWMYGERMSKTTFVTASSLSAGDAARHWREVALNPEENLVIRALQLLDPSIRQVAYVGPDRAYRLSDRGGMVVRRADSGERIPIGSLGDGAWRLLALALALTRSAGGTLLIDEVDTGFHYSIMTAMWKMVLTTAERLDVQVFATTHSQDCVSALATICTDEDRERIGLHRIEADAERAVAFSAKEIRIAAQRGIEVR